MYPKYLVFADIPLMGDNYYDIGNPSIRALNARGVAKYSDYAPIEGYISWKRCKIGGKLVLFTNRKSYMSFRLVSKSVTLNEVEQRNGPYVALFHRIRKRGSG